MLMVQIVSIVKMIASFTHKLIELHEAGVDEIILSDIHQLIHDVNEAVDTHHDKHIKGDTS